MGEILEKSVETHPKKHKKPRCHLCNKKLGHLILPPCRCGFVFCIQHQSKHSHKCQTDTKADIKKTIIANNPKIKHGTLTQM
jgi:hypothetical protein